MFIKTVTGNKLAHQAKPLFFLLVISAAKRKHGYRLFILLIQHLETKW